MSPPTRDAAGPPAAPGRPPPDPAGPARRLGSLGCNLNSARLRLRAVGGTMTGAATRTAACEPDSVESATVTS